MESGSPPKRVGGLTPKQYKEANIKRREDEHKADLEPLVKAYRREQKESAGEFEGMNCYNTLFVGRLAYEVTERKLLREFEVFGPVKDLKLIKDRQTGKSRGYAFIEFENEDDMKRAYRAADGNKLEGRAIVADVERQVGYPDVWEADWVVHGWEARIRMSTFLGASIHPKLIRHVRVAVAWVAACL